MKITSNVKLSNIALLQSHCKTSDNECGLHEPSRPLRSVCNHFLELYNLTPFCVDTRACFVNNAPTPDLPSTHRHLHTDTQTSAQTRIHSAACSTQTYIHTDIWTYSQTACCHRCPDDWRAYMRREMLRWNEEFQQIGVLLVPKHTCNVDGFSKLMLTLCFPSQQK